jgi:hypothetical protein
MIRRQKMALIVLLFFSHERVKSRVFDVAGVRCNLRADRSHDLEPVLSVFRPPPGLDPLQRTPEAAS